MSSWIELLDLTGRARVEPAEREPGELAEQSLAHVALEAAVDGMQPQQERRREQRPRAEQRDRPDAERPEPARVGTGDEQPGELGEEEEGRQLHEGDDRLHDPAHDERGAQGAQQAPGGLRAPGAAGGAACFRRRGGRLRRRRDDDLRSRLGALRAADRRGVAVPAQLAHRPALRPVPLEVLLRLREAELVADAEAQGLERAGLGRDPRVPVRPVARLDGLREGRRIAPGHPMDAARGDARQRDLAVLRDVLLQVRLDGHVVRDGAQDRADRRDRRGVPDEQVPRRRLLGDFEGRRAERRQRDLVPRHRLSRPGGGGPGRLMEHDVVSRRSPPPRPPR